MIMSIENVSNQKLKIKSCIISASSNPDSHCAKLATELLPHAKHIDITKKNIGFFNYKNENANDDFKDVITDMLEHDLIVLASPVYWYTISGQMKVFLDRWTDILMFYKEIRPKFKMKYFALISTYSGNQGFTEETVKLTGEYMGMHYLGGLLVSSTELKQDESIIKEKIDAFRETLENNLMNSGSNTGNCYI